MCYMSHWTTAHLLHSASLWQLLTAFLCPILISLKEISCPSVIFFIYSFFSRARDIFILLFPACVPFFSVLLNARLPYRMYTTFIFGHHSLSSSVLPLVLCSACRTKMNTFFKCLDSTQFGGHSWTETITLVYRSISWTPVKSLLP